MSIFTCNLTHRTADKMIQWEKKCYLRPSPTAAQQAHELSCRSSMYSFASKDPLWNGLLASTSILFSSSLHKDPNYLHVFTLSKLCSVILPWPCSSKGITRKGYHSEVSPWLNSSLDRVKLTMIFVRPSLSVKISTMLPNHSSLDYKNKPTEQ